MKSVSVIDKAFEMSEQNKMIKDIISNNGIEKMQEFKKDYVFPLLKEKNIEMPSNDYIIDEWAKICDYTMGFIKRFAGGIFKKYIEEKYNYLNYQKFNPSLTRNSSKVFDIPDDEKKLLARFYVDMIYKLSTFEEKCSNYVKQYIIPIIEKENKIVYDLTSKDENIQLITKNTFNLFLKYIREHCSMSLNQGFILGKDLFEKEMDLTKSDNEAYRCFNFLYNDDEEEKQYIANGLSDVFIEYYDEIDLTKKPSVNIKWLYLFSPREFFYLDEE